MRSIATIIAAAAVCTGASLALAQSDAPLVQNPRIKIDYEEPRHFIYGAVIDADDARMAKDFASNVEVYKKLTGVRQRMMDRRLLEEFSQFLAPLKLPITLRIVAKQCNTVNAFYDMLNSRIIICYEFVANAEDTAPKTPTAEGITREDAVIGATVGVLLHEGGHAVSNLLRLPVLGREEDTADQIAGYVMLQFGREMARTLIKGEAFGWHLERTRQSRLYGSHSTALQRQQMYLCLAYGADPEGFEEFIKYGWLPRERAANCGNEYKQAQHAFRTTIGPHLDMDLVKIVQSRKWLRPDDGKKRP